MSEFVKDHVFVSHAVAAASSAAFSSSITHPIDTLKSLLQIGAGGTQKLPFSQVADSIRSASGVQGLYNGFGWSVVGSLSGLAARFGVYEVLTAFYKDGREDNYVYVSEALLAGIAAGGVEAVISTPFQFITLRKQVASASISRTNCSTRESSLLVSKLLPNYTPDIKAWNRTYAILSDLPSKNIDVLGALKQYPWMLTGSGRPPLASEVKTVRDIVSLEGWSSLWKGLRPSIARDCVFGGMFFSTWQFFHIAMLNWKALDIDPPPSNVDEVGPVSPLASSTAAGISGVVAAASSHTFDTAKTRTQCIVTPKYIAMERKMLKWETAGIWFERLTGMSPADRNIMFRGIWLRMAKSGISSFAIVGGYLLTIDRLLQ